MGQQNLLIVVVGIMLVAIAVSVGISMFRGNSVEAARNNLIVDLGGGDRTFTGVRLDNLAYATQNENGRYYVENSTQDELVLVGVGMMISGEDTIRVRMRISERRNIVEILN